MSDSWQKTLGKVYTIFEMAEKSCDVGNTANTNDYIKTDNDDSNPEGGSNIKRVSSKSISKLQGSSNKNSNNVCLLP